MNKVGIGTFKTILNYCLHFILKKLPHTKNESKVAIRNIYESSSEFHLSCRESHCRLYCCVIIDLSINCNVIKLNGVRWSKHTTWIFELIFLLSTLSVCVINQRKEWVKAASHSDHRRSIKKEIKIILIVVRRWFKFEMRILWEFRYSMRMLMNESGNVWLCEIFQYYLII
jgi:hypothetical protein